MNRADSSAVRRSVTEVSLHGHGLSPREKTRARTILDCCHITEKDQVCNDYRGRFILSCYLRSASKVRRIRSAYRRSGKGPLRLRVKTLRQRDWFDKWKRDYRVRPLGAKFLIVPAWKKKRPFPSERIPLVIDPGSAFGSGYHETTRLMTRLLESMEGKIGSFLDIGTGTGILSIVAARLGACRVVGFDNDKPSAWVASRNFKANGCSRGSFLRAQLKNIPIRERFDTVGANLLSKTLLEHRAKMVRMLRSGGQLLVSGISIRNFPSFHRQFSGRPLRCRRILRGRSWVAAVYQKTRNA